MHTKCIFVIYLNQLLQLENGQSGAIVMASNSSDRSDRSDKPMDQKVLILSPMPSLVFITILYDCL
jgi:hypothetical protein